MGFWNCPCVPMRERKVRAGCHPQGSSRERPGRRCPALQAPGPRLPSTPGSDRARLCCCVRPPQECHCMLFLTEENDFAGSDQAITLDEVVEHTKGM